MNRKQSRRSGRKEKLNRKKLRQFWNVSACSLTPLPLRSWRRHCLLEVQDFFYFLLDSRLQCLLFMFSAEVARLIFLKCNLNCTILWPPTTCCLLLFSGPHKGGTLSAHLIWTQCSHHNGQAPPPCGFCTCLHAFVHAVSSDPMADLYPTSLPTKVIGVF